MSAFEFVFTLFGLLLGFSLVEVLGGLARVVERRIRPGSALRIGWLTPLLGLFVLLDLISFWGSAWAAREVLTVSSATLIGSLFFAGAYYLAAHLVFPGDLDGIDDLDAHFDRIKLPVMVPLFVLLLLQLAYWAWVPQLARLYSVPGVGWQIGFFVALFAAAILVRGRLWNALLLAALSLRYLIVAFL
ncbi:hypothetical protein ACFQ1E_10320 [Sphingomonas canadensis]|uniref:Uncharacterized protein n=1 Tax=Sphingomonas canadensis TaxID=1219257 RepID=A0ABW3HB95_9SPHN|nr:hypothetical protein [Sphingomonas canadensis]MCW3836487.1 hypothetical protein [Sphingomonas canadensis]